MANEYRSSYDPEFYNSHEKEYQTETLTLIRLRSVFILFLFGLFISILVFIFENFYNEAKIGDNMR